MNRRSLLTLLGLAPLSRPLLQSVLAALAPTSPVVSSGFMNGHGATVAIELDPHGRPGVFTTITELTGDIKWPELTAFNDGVEPKPMTFQVNYKIGQ